MEDFTGTYTLSLFGSDFDKHQWIFKTGNRIFVQTSVSVRGYIDKKTNEEKEFVDIKFLT